MPHHPLTSVWIQKYYQNEAKFNFVYSRNNFPKIKDGLHVINLDDYKSIRTHWIGLYANANNIVYSDIFIVEDVPKEIKIFIGNKNMITNI